MGRYDYKYSEHDIIDAVNGASGIMGEIREAALRAGNIKARGIKNQRVVNIEYDGRFIVATLAGEIEYSAKRGIETVELKVKQVPIAMMLDGISFN